MIRPDGANNNERYSLSQSPQYDIDAKAIRLKLTCPMRHAQLFYEKRRLEASLLIRQGGDYAIRSFFSVILSVNLPSMCRIAGLLQK